MPKLQSHAECYTGVFPKAQLVYLTADSDVEIERLESGKAYIIGAFVDRNRHKVSTQVACPDQMLQSGNRISLVTSFHLKWACGIEIIMRLLNHWGFQTC